MPNPRSVLALMLLGCGSTVIEAHEATDVRVVAHIPCLREPCEAETGEPPPLRMQGRPPATMLALGESHSCALTEDGAIYCWGANDHGQLGDLDVGPAFEPRRVPNLLPMGAVWAGANATCARTQDGSVLYCWGELGLGPHQEPTFAVALPFADVRDVVLGYHSGCFVDGSARTFCWGDFGSPYGPRWDSPSRVPVSGVSAISMGSGRVCGLDSRRRITCWGREFVRWERERLADPAWRLSDVGPVRLMALARSTDSYPWIVTDDGHVYGTAVGDEYEHDFDRSYHVRRDPVPGISGPASLVAGVGHACAVMSDTSAACWGDNNYGQIGDGSRADRRQARLLPLNGIEEVAAGDDHTCARASGHVYCWGRNDRGQAGAPGERPLPEPTEVPW